MNAVRRLLAQLGFAGSMSATAFAQDPAICREVSVGRFECTFEGITSVIQRTSAEQLEWGPESDLEFRLRVDWTGPCSYRLTPVAQENADDKQPEGPSQPIDCRITKVDELGYSVVVTWAGGPSEGLQMNYRRIP